MSEIKDRIVETVEAATGVVVVKPLNVKVLEKVEASEEDREKALEENTIGHATAKSDAVGNGTDVPGSGTGNRSGS